MPITPRLHLVGRLPSVPSPMHLNHRRHLVEPFPSAPPPMPITPRGHLVGRLSIGAVSHPHHVPEPSCRAPFQGALFYVHHAPPPPRRAPFHRRRIPLDRLIPTPGLPLVRAGLWIPGLSQTASRPAPAGGLLIYRAKILLEHGSREGMCTGGDGGWVDASLKCDVPPRPRPAAWGDLMFRSGQQNIIVT
jgi:hypothetical protein